MTATQGRNVVEGLEHRALEIPDLLVFRSERKTDPRGFVQPTYNAEYFRTLGIDHPFPHENHCFSPAPYTVRGFHYQLPPSEQPKLIRVTRGRMLDVNLDLRRDSPTFGRHAAVELTPDDWFQIYVPGGFAHCYATLEPDTEVIFKLGALFSPADARGLAYNDPDLGIAWPFRADQAIVLPRDLDRPRFSALTEFF